MAIEISDKNDSIELNCFDVICFDFVRLFAHASYETAIRVRRIFCDTSRTRRAFVQNGRMILFANIDCRLKFNLFIVTIGDVFALRLLTGHQ